MVLTQIGDRLANLCSFVYRSLHKLFKCTKVQVIIKTTKQKIATLKRIFGVVNAVIETKAGVTKQIVRSPRPLYIISVQTNPSAAKHPVREKYRNPR